VKRLAVAPEQARAVAAVHAAVTELRADVPPDDSARE
jgi:hypothetical protein